ncbi:TlpA disulfide reductase family protein [Pseudoxanthomonas sp. J35]|uniref:TlpA disulfide reductase family protein n=1 Tax=Pseudoxanthomonas sp. J35 TaxID=935852 RepID=UPI001E638627|nr:TlpA disulfide reductase family protein [Pseudoxanthomonas sp. J35]
MWMRWLLLAGLAMSTCLGAKVLPPSPAVGEIPPQLLGKTREGRTVNLGDYRGKVTIVTFWASWCGPCRKELPVLARFQDVVGRDALEVVAVNFKEPRSDFVALVRANKGMNLTFVHDADGATSDRYGVRAIPHMFILDHDGTVAYTHRGYSENALPGIIDEILSLLPDEVKNRPSAPAGKR